jgi:putative phage-type endonuclease
MQVHNVTQGTPEWHELRIKYPLTASEAQAIGNQGKGLETLVYEKMAVKYSSGVVENYTNKDLGRGVELEPQARDIYELETGNKVEQVGFVTNEDISKVCGASPDGMVGEDGLIEIKCFDDVKHFKSTIKLEIESKYVWQMQMQMLVTGRKWVDFVAYNPNYKKSLLIERVLADSVMQEKIKTGLAIGENLIKEIENKINEKV